MKSTRADVALKAGVSEATVSYVLNKSRPVADKTITKVMEAIKELDYHPDMIARSMVTGKYKQVSIIVNDIVNPLQGEVVIGFESAAMEKGYFVNICTASTHIEKYIYNFISRKNDGVYITAIPARFPIENLYKLLTFGVKLIYSGNNGLNDALFNHIAPAIQSASVEAVQYLRDLNHRKFAMISAFPRDFKYDNRIEAFCNAVSQTIPNASMQVVEGRPPYASDIVTGKALTRQLIESGSSFTAVFCTNDLMAYGCISELRKAGYRVPEDVSVVGVDDIVYSSDFTPSLTTIGYNKIEYGKKAFYMLEDDIQNGTVSSYVFNTRFIARESCGQARG